MNDIEKVIKTFDAQIAVAKEIRSDFVQLTVGEAKTALELLKEQKTTKPTVSIDTWICSKCMGQALSTHKKRTAMATSRITATRLITCLQKWPFPSSIVFKI